MPNRFDHHAKITPENQAALSAPASLNPLADPRELVAALFNSSTVGLAILDPQLRYTAVNDTLAAMNGLSAEAHLGRTVRDILGDAADLAEPVMRRAFATGEFISRSRLSAVLPIGTELRSWIVDYFPLKDTKGKVTQIAAIAVEVPVRTNLVVPLPELGNIALDAPADDLPCPACGSSKVARNDSPPAPHFRDHAGSVPRTTAELITHIGPPPRFALYSALFKDLDHRTAETILKASRIRRVAKGEYFCRQGEIATRLYILKSGRVKVSGTTQTGKEILVCWMGPGDVFGLDAVAKPAIQNVWSVCACEASEALELEKSTIQELAHSCPTFYQNALWIAVRWAHELQARFEQIATEVVEQRLARAVLDLAAPLNRNNAEPIELRASDEELAQMVGTTLFTVSKVLNRWKRLGHVQKGRKRLLIRDLAQLFQVAQGPPDESTSVA